MWLWCELRIGLGPPRWPYHKRIGGLMSNWLCYLLGSAIMLVFSELELKITTHCQQAGEHTYQNTDKHLDADNQRGIIAEEVDG